MPDITVEPPGGVVGLIQQSTYEGRCSLDNPCEMLTKASFLLVVLVVVVSIAKYRYNGSSAPSVFYHLG